MGLFFHLKNIGETMTVLDKAIEDLFKPDMNVPIDFNSLNYKLRVAVILTCKVAKNAFIEGIYAYLGTYILGAAFTPLTAGVFAFGVGVITWLFKEAIHQKISEKYFAVVGAVAFVASIVLMKFALSISYMHVIKIEFIIMIIESIIFGTQHVWEESKNKHELAFPEK